jgi:hypothetical protein
MFVLHVSQISVQVTNNGTAQELKITFYMALSAKIKIHICSDTHHSRSTITLRNYIYTVKQYNVYICYSAGVS